MARWPYISYIYHKSLPICYLFPIHTYQFLHYFLGSVYYNHLFFWANPEVWARIYGDSDRYHHSVRLEG